MRAASADPERAEVVAEIHLDSVRFSLKSARDFGWLKRYGRAFHCIDRTGSGCVCIGMEGAGKRYFCKIAGADTVEAEVSPEESVRLLQNALPLYEELRHPNLVKLIEAYAHGSLYAAVFEWADGECLFDHWNFERYKNDRTLKSPKERFRALPAVEKLRAVGVLFSFLQNTARKGYAAVDFYDGSILYDFLSGRVTLCDIDLFRKAPAVNDRGDGWYGTKRLKAPEEYRVGGIIDERTNLYTLGALIFDFFGEFSAEDIRQRYLQRRFLPCPLSRWELGEESYRAAEKAVCPSRDERWRTIEEFSAAWEKAVRPYFVRSGE